MVVFVCKSWLYLKLLLKYIFKYKVIYFKIMDMIWMLNKYKYMEKVLLFIVNG